MTLLNQLWAGLILKNLINTFHIMEGRAWKDAHLYQDMTDGSQDFQVGSLRFPFQADS